MASTDGASAPNNLEITLKALTENPALTDEELAPLLHLKRAASAQFWRLKAQEIIKVSSSNEAPTTEAIDVEVSS